MKHRSLGRHLDCHRRYQHCHCLVGDAQPKGIAGMAAVETQLTLCPRKERKKERKKRGKKGWRIN
jgi:hypothetical protein